LSERYCTDHNLTLADVPFEDKGVSAFKGRHATTGALSDFLSLVNSGNIKKGSHLLIESFDRLSREESKKALIRFLGLLEAGIVIVTLADNKLYNSDSDQMDVMYSLMIMGRAFEESQMKSQRLSAAWSSKRKAAQDEGVPLTRQCPAWIELKDGKYELRAEHSLIIRDIVGSAIGGLGNGTIAASLNKKGVKPFGRGVQWHTSYIQRILESPALYGTIQPKAAGVPVGPPIDNFYPAVIEKELFYKMRGARAKPLSKGAKGKGYSNILSGITTCSECGSVHHYKDKGRPPKGQKYLVCSKKIGGTCASKYARYDQIEIITLLTLTQIDVSRIVEPEKCGNKRADIEHAIDELQTKIDNFTAAIGSGSASILAALMHAETEQLKLKDKLENLSIENASTSPLRQVQSLIGELSKAEGKDLYELRERVHRLLRGAIASFNVDAEGKSLEIKLNDYSGMPFNFSKDVNGWSGRVSPA
jgi:DNA invertase Pin-like site-specific DNA recombinase